MSEEEMQAALPPQGGSVPYEAITSSTLEASKATTAFGRTVIRVNDVFSPQTLKDTNCFLDRPSGCSFSYSNQGNNLRGISIYKIIEDLDTSVFLDSNGKIRNHQNINGNICEEAKVLSPLVFESFEKMASILRWNDMKVPLEPQIICYSLDHSQDAIKDLPWHYDECTLTMSVIISPEIQGPTLYHGGKLSFARRAYENEPLIKGLKLVELNDFKFYPETEQVFPYTINGGFIFDNLHTVHKVSDILYSGPSGGKVERRLFTVFASPEVEYVRHLPDLVTENLV
ncbi:hypothetical protein [Endozoicomonas ascidiicola]|uniref:hypothetical protein n=1 Tax=Endozoicomonas ascidiicola TaxID=1698521 RepID=UPI00082BCC03|nr:hypothetical protein [Endozoicomonas ascidiicola]